MTPYELGRKGYEEFGDEALNPFDFANSDEYSDWRDFERGWRTRMQEKKPVDS